MFGTLMGWGKHVSQQGRREVVRKDRCEQKTSNFYNSCSVIEGGEIKMTDET